MSLTVETRPLHSLSCLAPERRQGLGYSQRTFLALDVVVAPKAVLLDFLPGTSVTLGNAVANDAGRKCVFAAAGTRIFL